MRVCAVLLLVSGMAIAGNLNPVTALPADVQPVPGEQVVRRASPVSTGEKDFVVGEVDTVGGTTYDWMANGPVYRMIANAPGYGVSVVWMFSASTSGTEFPDRNMRYNFYEFAAGEWNWIDPDYMASGVNVYTERSGYGNIDIDPVTSVAVTVCHNGSPLRPVAARDMAPGAGIFEFCNSSPNAEAYQWPPIAMNANRKIQCALIDNATQDQLYYTNCDPWCTWQVPVSIVGGQPDPAFPTHNIAASKLSQKVCIAWQDYNSALAYYRVSTDAGTSWDNTVVFEPPAAYGGDTVTTFHITSLFPWYDRQDRLHIVAGVGPVVNDTGYIIPAEIWHWCGDNSPAWSKIHRGGCDPANLLAAVGYNSLYAGRPSIGADSVGGLYVVWEQFDSSNVEPSTNLLRADIWYAEDNDDNGATWQPAVKITDPTTGSHRFPSCIDYVNTDTLFIVYEIDQTAGFYVQGQGVVTNNPIVVHKVHVTVGGVAEGPRTAPNALQLTACPNPVAGRTALSFGLPRAAEVSLVVYDMTGRPVATLAEGRRDAGRYTAAWQPEGLAPGIYLARLTAGSSTRTQKLTLTR